MTKTPPKKQTTGSKDQTKRKPGVQVQGNAPSISLVAAVVCQSLCWQKLLTDSGVWKSGAEELIEWVGSQCQPLCLSLGQLDPAAAGTVAPELLVCCRGKEMVPLSTQEGQPGPEPPQLQALDRDCGICLKQFGIVEFGLWETCLKHLLKRPGGGKSGLCLEPSQPPHKSER